MFVLGMHRKTVDDGVPVKQCIRQTEDEQRGQTQRNED